MSEKLKSVVAAAEGAAGQDSARLLLSSLLIGSISLVSTTSLPEDLEKLPLGIAAADELFALWRECVIHNYQLEVE